MKGTARAGKKMLLVGIVLGVIVGVAGAGAALFPRLQKQKAAGKEEAAKMADNKEQASHKKEGLTEEKAKSQPTAWAIVPLGEFLVNVSGSSGLHYVKAEIALKMAGLPEPETEKKSGHGGHGGHKKQDAQAAVELPEGDLAIARDRIVTVLSSSSFAELQTVMGRERLKQKIVQKLKEALPQYEFGEALFTAFVMQ